MKSDLLVIVKGNKPLQFKTDILKPNVFYRHLELKEGKKIEHLVHGIVFSDKDFFEKFEAAYQKVINDWNLIGLLKDGKSISKSQFKKLADIHTYGRGKKSLNIWYFRNSIDIIYGFYPSQGNLKIQLEECYEWYLEMISGNLESIDNGDICFGNRGIPLCYGKLSIN